MSTIPAGLDVRDVRKKPLVIQSVLVTTENIDLIVQWITESGHHAVRDTDQLTIQTLEGPFVARPGDRVMRGVKGEFYRHEGGEFYAEIYDDLGAHTEDAA